MKKLYYSIGEITELTGLPPHVLRNWEKTYTQLKPKKNSAGNRVYKEEEVHLIFKIKGLLESKKYTSEGIKRMLNAEYDSENSTAQLSSKMHKDLTEMRAFLTRLLQKL
jgi:DNA-binding transcriptional MerR regulator